MRCLTRACRAGCADAGCCNLGFEKRNQLCNRPVVGLYDRRLRARVRDGREPLIGTPQRLAADRVVTHPDQQLSLRLGDLGTLDQLAVPSQIRPEPIQNPGGLPASV